MYNIIVTLTTISKRLDHIHLVIESLLQQEFSYNSYEVRLYLSENPYLLDKGCPELTPQLYRLTKKNKGRFQIKYVENTGPHRKILPVLNEVYSLSQSEFSNTLIITADDDTIYPRLWLNTLFESFIEHRCVIGYRGRQITFSDGKPSLYKKWSKVLESNLSLLNVPVGKDGVLYSPLHLHPFVLNYENAYRVAPKTDDLWLKIHSLLINVPSFIINTELGDELPTVQVSEPTQTLYDVYNMGGGNDAAVSNLEDYLKDIFSTNIFNLCGFVKEDVCNNKIYFDCIR